MSLTNSYERKLAKNLFLTNGSVTSGTDIAGKTEIYMGLHINDSVTPGGGPDLSTDVDITDLVEPHETTANTSDVNLISGDPGDGSSISLDSNTGYHRIPMNNSKIIDNPSPVESAFTESTINAYTAGPLANDHPIKFPTATAVWGEVTGWFLTDTDDLTTKGDVYLTGAVNNPTEIESGDRAIFNTAALSVSIQ